MTMWGLNKTSQTATEFRRLLLVDAVKHPTPVTKFSPKPRKTSPLPAYFNFEEVQHNITTNPFETPVFKGEYSLNHRIGLLPSATFCCMLSIFLIIVYILVETPINVWLKRGHLLLGTTMLSSYLITMVRDPAIKQILRNDDKEANLNASPRYCALCKIVKPPYCNHCSRCGSCIADQHHHCPWIGRCIGKDNHLPFFIFVLSTMLYMVYSLLVLGIHVFIPNDI